MNSVAPLQVGARSDSKSEVGKGPSLHHFGDILTVCLSTSNTKTQREMIELPVGSKPGWEHEQSDPDQEESLELKSTADRSASFVLARPWLT